MKKALSILKCVIVWLIVALALVMMLFTVFSATKLGNGKGNIFGYSFFKVLSDSMSKTDFDAGDLIVVKEVDPASLKAGDIIAYQSTNTENYGAVVTHKIRSVTTDSKGNKGFITYGTTTDTNDENIVLYYSVLGKYQFAIPKLGYFFEFLKTTPGYIVCIFLPFTVLMLVQGIKSIRLFKQYKAEQLNEIKTEREKMEEERKNQEELLQRLIKMQDELQKLKENQ